MVVNEGDEDEDWVHLLDAVKLYQILRVYIICMWRGEKERSRRKSGEKARVHGWCGPWACN